MFQVVIDTNVLVSALRSKRGASYRLIMMLGDSRWQANVSVSLLLEYEQVAKRQAPQLGLTEAEVDRFLASLCSKASLQPIFFLWRPALRDPKDEHILELAVASESDFIVTFNAKDFVGAERFGVAVLTPGDFLRKLGGIG